MGQERFSFIVEPQLDIEGLRRYVRQAVQEIQALGRAVTAGEVPGAAAAASVANIQSLVAQTRAAAVIPPGQARAAAAVEGRATRAGREFDETVTKREQAARLDAARLAGEDVNQRRQNLARRAAERDLINRQMLAGEDIVRLEAEEVARTRTEVARKESITAQMLANDAEYLTAQGLAAAAKRREAVRTELIANTAALTPGAIGEAARLETQRRRLRRSIELQANEAALAGGNFTEEARLRLSRQRLARAIEARAIELTSTTDIADEGRLRASRRRLARAYEQAAIAETTTGDIAEEGRLRAAKRRLARSYEAAAITATTTADVAEEGRLRAAKRRLARSYEAAALAATSTGDIAEEGRLRAAKRRLARAYEAAALANTSAADIAEEGRLRAAKRRQARQIERQTISATSVSDIAEEGRLRVAKRRLARAYETAAINQTSAADISREADLRLAKQRLRRQIEQQVAAGTTGADISADAALKVTKRRLRRQLELQAQAATTAADLGEEARVAAVRRTQRAQIERATQEALAADAAYATNTAAAAAARARIKLSVAGEAGRLGVPEQEGRATAAEQLNTERRRLAESRELLRLAQVEAAARRQGVTVVGSATRLEAQRMVIDRQITQLKNQQAREEAERLGLLRQGTITQRLQARLSLRRGGGLRLPEEFQSFGQLAGSRVLTTASFAASGALLYGGIRAVRELIQEGEKVEVQFSLLQDQLEQVDAAGTFPQLREGILAISRDTGVAAGEVAFVATQLRGAFSDLGSDAEIAGRVLTESAAAFKLVRITGLPTQEITDSLTAISRAFNVSFEDIGDAVTAVRAQFGVLEAETVGFLGDIAPVASEAGLSLNELAGVAGIVQARTGRSGTALAEALGRIIPAMSESATALLTGLQSAGAPAELIDRLTADIAEGGYGQAIIDLGLGYGDLNDQQRDFINTTIGSRREAQTLIPLLQGISENVDLFSTGLDTNGRLAEAWERRQNTLNQQIAEFATQMRQLGLQLYEGGIGDGLRVMAETATLLASGISDLVGMFTGLNDALGGVPGRLLLVVAAFRSLVAMRGLLGGLFGGGAQLGGITAAGGPALVNGLLGMAGFAGGAAASRVGIGGILQLLAAGRAGGGGIGVLGGGVGRGMLGGLASISPWVLGGIATATAGSLVFNQYQKDRDQARKRIESFREEMAKQIQEGEKEVVEEFAAASNESLGSRLDRGTFEYRSNRRRAARQELAAYAVENDKLVEQLNVAREEIGEQVLDDLIARLTTTDNYANGNDPGFLGRQIDKLPVFGQERFETEDEGLKDLVADLTSENAETVADAVERARLIIAELKRTDPRVASAIQDFLDELRRSERVAAVSEQLQNDIIPTLDQAIADFEAGAGSVGEVINAYESAINVIRSIAEGDPARLTELAKTQAAYNRFLDDLGNRQNEVADTLGRLRGETPVQRLGRLESFVNQARTPEERLSRANELVQAVEDVIAYERSQADTLAEELEILRRPREIPEVARTELVREQLRTLGPEWDQYVRTAARLLGLTQEEFTNTIVQQAIASETGVVQVQASTRRMIEIALYQLTVTFNTLSKMGPFMRGEVNEVLRQINILEQSLANLPTDLTVDAGPATTSGAQLDPEEERRLQKQRDDELKKMAQDAAEARLELARVYAERDPVRLAQIELEAADLMAQAARETETEADDIRAVAARVRAEHQLRDAMLSIVDSQRELAIAMAEAAGDTVGVAELQLQQAYDNLVRAQNQGAGEAELNSLRAQVVANQANVRDTQLASKQGDIDFALEMGRITTAQAIAQLQALLKFPEITEQQTRELQRRIKQLQDEASQDFAFNLPSELTAYAGLYTVRRLDEARQPTSFGQNLAEMATTTVDNRQISFQIAVSKDADWAKGVDLIVDAINGPSRFGTRPRLY